MHTPGVVFLRDEAVSVDCCTGGPKVMPAKDKASVGMGGEGVEEETGAGGKGWGEESCTHLQ